MIKQQYSDINLPYKAEYNLLQQHEKHTRDNILSQYKAAIHINLAFWWVSEITFSEGINFLPVSKNAF